MCRRSSAIGIPVTTRPGVMAPISTVDLAGSEDPAVVEPSDFGGVVGVREKRAEEGEGLRK